MKFEELIAELDVRKVPIEPEPINSDFVSLGELLLRLRTTLAKPLTLTQVAHILLSLGFRTGGAPEWKCNGKLGIVPIEAFNYEWAVKRLEYVFHNNRFESDGNGASTDYEFFGFNRKEFSDFLALKLDESLDLFCPMPEPQAGTAPVQNTAAPAPMALESAPGGVEPDKAEPLPVEQGLSTKDIAHAFDGVNGWNVDRWTKNLSAAKWLHPARTALGGAGGASSVWSPLMLAQLMHDSAKGEREKEKLMKVFNSRFTRNPALGLWRDAFNDYFATHCATD